MTINCLEPWAVSFHQDLFREPWRRPLPTEPQPNILYKSALPATTATTPATIKLRKSFPAETSQSSPSLILLQARCSILCSSVTPSTAWMSKSQRTIQSKPRDTQNSSSFPMSLFHPWNRAFPPLDQCLCASLQPSTHPKDGVG